MQEKIITAIHCFNIVLFGTLSGLNGKFQYETKANGLPDRNGSTLRNFEHPWLQVFIMFIGESLSLLVFAISRLSKKDKSDETKKISKLEEPKDIFSKYSKLFMSIPAFCDMTSSGMSGIGLLWLDSSIVQMLSGAGIIFSGILTKLVLKRAQSKQKWLGIATTSVGITMISLAFLMRSYMSDKSGIEISSPQYVTIGLCLVILSQLISAIQNIIEEYFLKSVDISPLEAVGYQGVFGMIFTMLLLIILQYAPGSSLPSFNQEDSLDAIEMLRNSKVLVALIVAFIFIIFMLNYSSMTITKRLSSVHKAIVSTLRSFIIWMVEIFIYYALKNKDYGRSLDVWTILEVAGFGTLMLGTILYNLY